LQAPRIPNHVGCSCLRYVLLGLAQSNKQSAIIIFMQCISNRFIAARTMRAVCRTSWHKLLSLCAWTWFAKVTLDWQFSRSVDVSFYLHDLIVKNRITSHIMHAILLFPFWSYWLMIILAVILFALLICPGSKETKLFI
jgi:hypothetical protein